MHIIEDPTVIEKKSLLFFYFNLRLSVQLESLSCSFTPIRYGQHDLTSGLHT